METPMPLTKLEVQNSKPKNKPYKLGDQHGLYLLVWPTGAKYWRWKYHYGGKECVFSLGVYPEITLAEVRERHEDLRRLLKKGVNPRETKREERRTMRLQQANTFEKLAREWLEVKRSGWTEYYAAQTLQRLEKDVFPKIGRYSPESITASDIYDMAQSIQNRGAYEMAHRAVQICGGIFDHGVITDRCQNNPARMIRNALKTRKTKHHAYLTSEQLPEFILDLKKYKGSLQTKIAVELLMHTFVRTAELCEARWEEINFEKREWKIPAERMKMSRAHVVPLSDHVTKLFGYLRSMNSRREHVFPSVSHPRKPMSKNTMLVAIHAMGYKGKMTGHGFRATASTILNESRLFSKDVIERQLAHIESNKVRAAYDHSEHLDARLTMMDWWSNYLLTISAEKS